VKADADRTRYLPVAIVRVSSMTDGEGRDDEPREVDGEHTSHVREVARIDPALARFHAPPAEGQAQAPARR
jgi:hypothetical protein